MSDEKHRIALKSKLYSFQMQRECSINEHLNRYTKLLTDLVNMDVEIDEEDKAVILLNSLPVEKYETFTLTLINGRKSLNYNDCLLYTSPSPRDRQKSRMPSSA